MASINMPYFDTLCMQLDECASQDRLIAVLGSYQAIMRQFSAGSLVCLECIDQAPNASVKSDFHLLQQIQQAENKTME
jgi:hypothetical protein